MKIIITDLTRFANKDMVCIARMILKQTNASGLCHIFKKLLARNSISCLVQLLKVISHLVHVLLRTMKIGREVN